MRPPPTSVAVGFHRRQVGKPDTPRAAGDCRKRPAFRVARS